ncbi:unnamed protein product [Urochloa humidicola]
MYADVVELINVGSPECCAKIAARIFRFADCVAATQPHGPIQPQRTAPQTSTGLVSCGRCISAGISRPGAARCIYPS